jgi:hypothetical protein
MEDFKAPFCSSEFPRALERFPRYLHPIWARALKKDRLPCYRVKFYLTTRKTSAILQAVSQPSRPWQISLGQKWRHPSSTCGWPDLCVVLATPVPTPFRVRHGQPDLTADPKLADDAPMKVCQLARQMRRLAWLMTVGWFRYDWLYPSGLGFPWNSNVTPPISLEFQYTVARKGKPAGLR